MLAGNPRRFGQGLEVGDRIHTEAERHLFLQVLNRVLKGFAEAVKKLVDLGLADDQRRAASDDVAGQRPHDEAVFLGTTSHERRCFLGDFKGLLCRLVLDDLQAPDQTHAAVVSHQWVVAQLRQPGLQLGMEFPDS